MVTVIRVNSRHLVRQECDKQLDQFMYNAYNEAKGKVGEVKAIKGFNIVDNTLPFCNISINPKDKGNCSGYCYVTRELFQNTLIKTLRKNFKKVYDVSFLNDANLNIYTIEEIITEDTIEYEVSKDVLEILKAVAYYHKRAKIKSYQIMPKTYYSNGEAIGYEISYLASRVIPLKWKLYKTMDLKELLLNKLDANKLVMIAMCGYNKKGTSGHCVLAYKYEILGSDEIKVYVYDCNIPVTEENNVAECIFILFKLLEGEWQYIYRPFIEAEYYSDKNYNSYAPGSTIKFL